MTAYAARAHKVWLAQVAVEGDGLMAAVLARGVATTTANAFLTVEGGIHDGVAVEVGGRDEIRQLLSYQV